MKIKKLRASSTVYLSRNGDSLKQILLKIEDAKIIKEDYLFHLDHQQPWRTNIDAVLCFGEWYGTQYLYRSEEQIIQFYNPTTYNRGNSTT